MHSDDEKELLIGDEGYMYSYLVEVRLVQKLSLLTLSCVVDRE